MKTLCIIIEKETNKTEFDRPHGSVDLLKFECLTLVWGYSKTFKFPVTTKGGQNPVTMKDKSFTLPQVRDSYKHQILKLLLSEILWVE